MRSTFDTDGFLNFTQTPPEAVRNISFLKDKVIRSLFVVPRGLNPFLGFQICQLRCTKSGSSTSFPSELKQTSVLMLLIRQMIPF